MLKNEYRLPNEIMCIDNNGTQYLTYLRSYSVDKYRTLNVHTGAAPGKIYVFNDIGASERYDALRFQLKTAETEAETKILRSMPHLITSTV